MNICPNKSSKEYQDLIIALGSEPKAFQAWYRHNAGKAEQEFSIPSASDVGVDDPQAGLSEFNASFTHPDITNVVDKVGQRIFHAWNEIGRNFAKYRDQPMPEPFSSLNPVTGKVFTFQEWLEHNVNIYTKRYDELIEIDNNVAKPDYLSSMKLEDLRALNIRLETDFNVAGGTLKEEFGLLFTTVRTAYGSKLVAEMMKKHTDAGHDVSSIKPVDATTFDLGVTAITDFGAENPELQALGIISQKHFSKAEREAQQTLAKLNTYMKKVIDAHFAHKGEEWLSKINLFVDNKYVQKAFEWMIEKSPEGKPTGRFISRYKENEKQMLDKAFERTWSDQDQREVFVISNKKILAALAKGQPSTYLNPVELKEFLAIVNRFRTIYSKGYSNLSNTEARTHAEDTNKIRRFWAKMHVKFEDSQYFADLKSVIASNPNSAEAKLAQAKIEFYDFIYDKSSELMFHNDRMDYSIERAIMPQVGIQVMEAFSRQDGGWRNKLKKVWQVFFRDENIDTETLRTHDGLLVSNVNFASFKSASKIPLRTVNPIKDFSENGSTDIYGILRYHFANQINAKNLSPLLSDFHAVYTHLDKQGVDSKGKEFVNSKKYLEQFVEQYVLSKTADWERMKVSKVAALMKNIQILQFLGLNPATSAMNLMQGLSEDMKMMIGKYGYDKGMKMIGIGFQRMFGTSMTNMDTIGFDQKSFAILEYYGIETFTRSEVEKFNSWAGKAQDLVLILQSKGESIIWGVGLLGQMSNEEWDNFYLDDKGALMVKNPQMIRKYAGLLDLHPLFEQKYNIGSVQGKYYTGGRRLTKDKPLLHLMLPFKGWIFDYFRSRFQGEKINQFSKKEEGYYRTPFKVAANKAHALFSARAREAQALAGKDKLNDLEKQNLRMISYDVMLGCILVLLHATAGNEDRKENAYEKFIAKIARQLYLQLYFEEVVKLIKQPFATLHDVEMGAKLIQGAITADPDKIGKAMYGVLPSLGKKTVDNLMEDENNK